MSDVSRYVQRQPSGIYRYYRRVPVEVAHVDRRMFVKKSLKTKNHKEALERADEINRATEALWSALAAGNDNKREWERYETAVRLAQSLGFAYRTAKELAAGPLAEMDARLSAADETPAAAVAVTGLAPSPKPRVSDIWDMYARYNQAGFTGMSPSQMSKHEVSRKRAVAYLKELLGDVRLAEITRADTLRFRQWWTDKIAAEGLRAYSANRSFSDIKGMLTVIDDALQTTYREPWDKIRIKETNATKLRKRAPFPADWIQNKILATGALDNLNEDARLIVYAMIETGARLGEICNLRPQDIHLDDDVPHIEIAERDDRRQKTEYSIRRIPLVGVSLWAMRQKPGGFPRYRDKADSASAIINKVLLANKLRPTTRHTAYSFRHTFQDRIENAGASDRMQADLMGHEFGRPAYGDGADMKRRQEFLEGIKFRWPG